MAIPQNKFWIITLYQRSIVLDAFQTTVENEIPKWGREILVFPERDISCQCHWELQTDSSFESSCIDTVLTFINGSSLCLGTCKPVGQQIIFCLLLWPIKWIVTWASKTFISQPLSYRKVFWKGSNNWGIFIIVKPPSYQKSFTNLGIHLDLLEM